MNETKLKPCPFCGKEKLKVETKQSLDRHHPHGGRINRVTASVRCMCCFARGPAEGGKVLDGMRRRTDNPEETCILTTHIELKQKAIEAWNRRA